MQVLVDFECKNKREFVLKLETEDKIEIFDRIFQEYVIEHGLGGMSKADFDALFLWLVAERQNEINSFDLSNTFKIKESRIKSLLETAAVKFDNTTETDAWTEILKTFSKIEYDVESLERGQIRFQLKNPMLYRWLQERVRMFKSTCSYHKASEQVTMNLDVVYKILDSLWDKNSLNDDWNGRTLTTAQTNIKKAIKQLSLKIEINALEDLRERKRTKLLSAIQLGASLASIGNFLSPLLNKISE